MRWTHWILYLVSLPWDVLVAWPVVLLIRVLWGKNLRWETPPPYSQEKGGGGGPVLVCQMRPGSFPVTPGVWPKGWYIRREKGKEPRPWGGTTLGHGIFYGPNVSMDGWVGTRAHEHVHVEQMEVAMLGAFLVALAAGGTLLGLGHPVEAAALAGAIWASGYLMMGVAGWITAILRGEPAYWGSTHEESARAQDDHLA
jgi:hypothetical protein